MLFVALVSSRINSSYSFLKMYSILGKLLDQLNRLSVSFACIFLFVGFVGFVWICWMCLDLLDLLNLKVFLALFSVIVCM